MAIKNGKRPERHKLHTQSSFSNATSKSGIVYRNYSRTVPRSDIRFKGLTHWHTRPRYTASRSLVRGGTLVFGGVVKYTHTQKSLLIFNNTQHAHTYLHSLNITLDARIRVKTLLNEQGFIEIQGQVRREWECLVNSKKENTSECVIKLETFW